MKSERKKPELSLTGSVITASRPQVKPRHQLKETVKAAIQREFSSLSKREPQLLQLALNEAAALAWWTKFPELFFPTLAQEKVEAVARWDARQRALVPAEHGDSIELAA